MKNLWAEILTPSRPLETAYMWLLIAIAHAVVGAALVGIVGMWALALAPLRVLIPVSYWWFKERADLRKGGQIADGLVDTAFVALGTFYGPGWWPAAVIVAAFAGAVLRSGLSRRDVLPDRETGKTPTSPDPPPNAMG